MTPTKIQTERKLEGGGGRGEGRRGGGGLTQTVQNVLSPSAKPLQQASIHWGGSSPAFPQRHPASQRAPEGLEANWEWAPWRHRPDTPVKTQTLTWHSLQGYVSFSLALPLCHSQCVDVQPKHLWCLWRERRGWSRAHRKRRVGFKGLASLQKTGGRVRRRRSRSDYILKFCLGRVSACIFVHVCMHNNVRKQTSADVTLRTWAITDAT